MRNSTLLWILLATLLSVSASAQIYTTKDGTISFTSEAPMEKIEASTTSINTILNTKNNSLAFIVPIRGFKFKKDLMEEHFNEKYMESDKYPNASFSGKIKEEIDWSKDGTYPATAVGKMKIHGVEKEKSYDGKVTIKSGEISLESGFPVAIAEFEIQKPKLVFQNIADTVVVKMNVNFRPYKK